MITSFLKNGKGKINCEDCTSQLELTEDPYYATMCLTDGCSTSPGDVVYGSRFFHRTTLQCEAIAAKKIKELTGSYNAVYEQTHIEVINRLAYFPVNTFILQEEGRELIKISDLYFTLLNAVINERMNFIKVRFFGDGALYVEDFEGNSNFVTFDYENNTPAYIGYCFEKGFDFGQIVMNQHGLCDICIDDQVKGHYYDAEFKFTDVKKLIMFSDGIEQIEGISAEEFARQIAYDDITYDRRLPIRKANHLLKERDCLDDISFQYFFNVSNI